MTSPVRYLTDDQYAALPPQIRALFVAARECDVKHVQEIPHGSNDGPDVRRYLHSVGLGPGNPWCASFVSCCSEEAGSHVGPTSGRGAVRNWASWASSKGRLRSTPERGDAFYYLNPDKTGHIGFVTAVHADGSFDTIEGNTNDDGSREGYEVARRTRKGAQYHFINLA